MKKKPCPICGGPMMNPVWKVCDRKACATEVQRIKNKEYRDKQHETKEKM